MLYVTGADWFCMCDRAGPEAPAMGDNTGTQMFKWVRWLSQTWLCLQTSPDFPGLAFVAHSFVQLKFTSNLGQLFPVVVNQCISPLQHGMSVVLTRGSLTPCVDHSPTPPVGHSEALHLFCFQFPHKWLWGHLGPMYRRETTVPVFLVSEVRVSS